MVSMLDEMIKALQATGPRGPRPFVTVERDAANPTTLPAITALTLRVAAFHCAEVHDPFTCDV